MPPDTIIPPIPGVPTIVDLFAGVGGISLGATRAGFQLSLAVELDDKAMAAHRLNFPNSNHFAGDVSEMDGDEILRRAGLREGELDGLVGGPPCQGFSVMGHRTVDDPRNSLFVKFFELVAESRPKFFVAENVLGILTPDFDAIRAAAYESLGGAYVCLEPIRIKASDLGAPTIRTRVFFIGYLAEHVEPLTEDDFRALRVETPINVARALTGLPAIEGQEPTDAPGWRNVEVLEDESLFALYSDGVPEGVGDPESIRRLQEEGLVSGFLATRHSDPVQARYGRLGVGEQDNVSKSIRLDPDGLCHTLRAGTGPERGSHQAVRPIHPTLPRVICPREAARLQGFPDWFQFDNTKWHSFRQIGNSVSPIVSEAVLALLRQRLIEDSPL